MNYLILIIVAGVSFWIGRKTAGGLAPLSREALKDLQSDAHEALGERTRKRKEKILEFMKKEAVHEEELKLCGIDSSKEEFTREDVEKLLEVSDSTARRYLNDLEVEGKISQIGESGRGVHYVLKSS